MYHKIWVSPTPGITIDKVERQQAALQFRQCIQLRDAYLYKPIVPEQLDARLQKFQAQVRATPLAPPRPPTDDTSNTLSVVFGDDGIGRVTSTNTATHDLVSTYKPPFTLSEFNRDVTQVWAAAAGKLTRSFAFRRLRMLDVNYEFHTLMNETYELNSTKNDKADFNQVTKVDIHLHAASAFTRQELLQFIKTKAIVDKDRVVLADGTTMGQVLSQCGISDVDDITTESLDVAANASMFHRFDNFNDSYNPFGAKDLRTIFMKTSNHIQGKYFSELIRDVVIDRVQRQQNRVAIEPRLSIYGRGGMAEWEALSNWIVDHQVLDLDATTGATTGHVRWMVQIPRLCNIFMGKAYANFAGLMKNIFEPMFLATLYPDKYPKVYTFLAHVGGIDCVDDESNHDPLLMTAADTPACQYTTKANPPYSYWCYHIYANLFALNRLRESKGLNTFHFKPHCGESGPRHHLATSYLLAKAVNHGWRLDLEPAMQYLYYCSQIGLGLCPLSNDSLFITLKNSPIGKLANRGLNVCLGTDDPLQFHNTNAPLLEEYTVAGHFFDFTATDKSEIARNSVLMSGFDHHWKREWLGEHYMEMNDVLANTQDKSNISNIRTHYRHTNLMRELNYIASLSGMAAATKATATGAKAAIGYLTLAGHTFPDPKCLKNVMQSMFEQYQSYEELILADNVATQDKNAASLVQLATEVGSVGGVKVEEVAVGETKTSSGGGGGDNDESIGRSRRKTVQYLGRKNMMMGGE